MTAAAAADRKSASADRFDIYQHVTDKIVDAIESGTAGKWRMPWHYRVDNVRGVAMMPQNVIGRPYRGINVWLLMSEKLSNGYTSDVWGTYKAWSAAGAQVRKGERGTVIVFWKKLTIKERDETGVEKPKQIMMARGYSVFNADQVDNWHPKAKPVATVAERIAHAETFFAAIPATVNHGGNVACYRPFADQIHLPNFDQFKTPEDYYSTRGHETGHWTGHASRLAREFGKRFGNEAYAFEELVAELCAAFLCAHLQISNEPRPDHAAYLANWLGILKADKRAVFTAASKAQQAADYIINAAGDAASAEDEAEDMGMAA